MESLFNKAQNTSVPKFNGHEVRMRNQRRITKK